MPGLYDIIIVAVIVLALWVNHKRKKNKPPAPPPEPTYVAEVVDESNPYHSPRNQ